MTRSSLMISERQKEAGSLPSVVYLGWRPGATHGLLYSFSSGRFDCSFAKSGTNSSRAICQCWVD